MFKLYENIKPMLGNVIGAEGYYSACIRGRKSRPDCDPQFWNFDMKDGYLTRYDVNMLPSYAPQSLKNNLLFLSDNQDFKFVYSIIFRQYAKNKTIVLGWAIFDRDNKLLKQSNNFKTYKHEETFDHLLKLVR